VASHAPASQINFKTIITELAENGWSVVHNVFPPQMLKDLKQELQDLDNEDRLVAAGVGRGGSYLRTETIRKDKIHLIVGDTPTQTIFLEKMEQMRLELNRNLLLGLWSFEAHYAVYKPGAFYKRHSDSFKGQKNRILSMVLYLNEDWQQSDGGILKLYEDENHKESFADIIPQMGTLITFLSEDIPHEVIASNRRRYSIAGWFRCNEP
jgi:SM-20-related protein